MPVGLEGIGKLLIGGAIVLLVVGGLFLLLSRLGLDRLPGDLVFRRGNLTVYFPIGVMILVSIVGTILLNLFLRR
jgi:multisubunit Na+/H+ antiporter MnhG subunit